MKARAHVFVRGKVQGVFFRIRTTREARIRNLTGWVRNLGDGSVEAVFEGDRKFVNQMVAFCRRGPLKSLVTKVDVFWGEPTGEYGIFSIWPTLF